MTPPRAFVLYFCMILSLEIFVEAWPKGGHGNNDLAAILTAGLVALILKERLGLQIGYPNLQHNSHMPYGANPNIPRFKSTIPGYGGHGLGQISNYGKEFRDLSFYPAFSNFEQIPSFRSIGRYQNFGSLNFVSPSTGSGLGLGLQNQDIFHLSDDKFSDFEMISPHHKHVLRSYLQNEGALADFKIPASPLYKQMLKSSLQDDDALTNFKVASSPLYKQMLRSYLQDGDALTNFEVASLPLYKQMLKSSLRDDDALTNFKVASSPLCKQTLSSSSLQNDDALTNFASSPLYKQMLSSSLQDDDELTNFKLTSSPLYKQISWSSQQDDDALTNLKIVSLPLYKQMLRSSQQNKDALTNFEIATSPLNKLVLMNSLQGNEELSRPKMASLPLYDNMLLNSVQDNELKSFETVPFNEKVSINHLDDDGTSSFRMESTPLYEKMMNSLKES